MDINTIRGLSTLVLLFAFIGLVVWVYSARRKNHFDEAARLPFEDDAAHRRTVQETVKKNPSSRGPAPASPGALVRQGDSDE